MRVVIDTNVLVSGVFFGGLPGRILEAWKDEHLTLVVSPAILDEYHHVARVLASKYRGVDLDPLLGLLAINADIIDAPEISEDICDDPDDDKFLACAVAGFFRLWSLSRSPVSCAHESVQPYCFRR